MLAVEGCNLTHAQPVEARHESLQHPGAVKPLSHPRLWERGVLQNGCRSSPWHCLQLVVIQMRRQKHWSPEAASSLAGSSGRWTDLALCNWLEAKVWELEAHMAVALQSVRLAGPQVSARDRIKAI